MTLSERGVEAAARAMLALIDTAQASWEPFIEKRDSATSREE